ncbi:MAG: glycosyl transferase, partial [Planctomycetota bacterium]
ATPVGIWVWTLLLAGGFLLPWAVLPLGEPLDVAHDDATKLAMIAIATGYLFRTVIAVRFKQSAISVLLGPVGIAALLALQWQAWRRDRVGKPVGWKGRPAVGAGEAV